MGLDYVAWVNRIEANNVYHTDRTPDMGGIDHLPSVERAKILNTKTVPEHKCCMDAYWLFRIYQDTVVDIPELMSVISARIKDRAWNWRKLDFEEIPKGLLPAKVRTK